MIISDTPVPFHQEGMNSDSNPHTLTAMSNILSLNVGEPDFLQEAPPRLARLLHFIFLEGDIARPNVRDLPELVHPTRGMACLQLPERYGCKESRFAFGYDPKHISFDIKPIEQKLDERLTLPRKALFVDRGAFMFSDGIRLVIASTQHDPFWDSCIAITAAMACDHTLRADQISFEGSTVLQRMTLTDFLNLLPMGQLRACMS
jgi:hypothetical protein